MIYQFENIYLDTELYQLKNHNAVIAVEPRVFDLLAYLIDNRNRVVTRKELLGSLWQGHVVSDAALSACLKAARKAVGDNGRAQNIIKTVHGRGYQFIASVSESTQVSSINTAETTQQVTSGPSIAVFPFTNVTGDADQRYFAEGITLGITTELSKNRPLVVKSAEWLKDLDFPIQTHARELNVRYLLKGSVHKQGDRVRVTAELIDGADGSTRWSELFDRQGKDVIAIQDEVSHQIAAILWGYRGKIQDADLERLTRKPAASFDAYDFVLRGVMYKERFSREDNVSAIDCFKKAIELDSQYAEAHSWLAWEYAMDFYMGWSNDPATLLASALAEAKQAIKLDRYCAIGHSALGFILQLSRQYDEALSIYDRLLGLYPHNADCIALRAGVLASVGRADEAVTEIQRAIELNPYHPEWYWWHLGIACYIARRYEDAIAALNRMISHNEESLLYLIASYAQLGQPEQAQAKMRQLFEIDSGFALSNFQISLKNTADLEHVLAGLRQAGLSE